MNIYIMQNKRFVQRFSGVVDENVAAVMCTSYDVDEQAICGIGKKIVLHFDDTENVRLNAFTPALGMQIKTFVDGLRDEMLYVCCDSGESRSSAIAAAILKYRGESNLPIWDDPHYHPNLLVYNLLCECFGKKTPKFVLRYLKWRNDRALKNAINRNRKRRSR